MMPQSIERTGKAPRIVAALAGALLVTTAIYHGSGFDGLASMLRTSSLEPQFVPAISGLWLFFSWHLLVLSAPPIWAAVTGRPWYRPVLLFCGVVALGDFSAVLWAAGWFPGTVILLVIVFCFLVSGYFWERRLPV